MYSLFPSECRDWNGTKWSKYLCYANPEERDINSLGTWWMSVCRYPGVGITVRLATGKHRRLDDWSNPINIVQTTTHIWQYGQYNYSHPSIILYTIVTIISPVPPTKWYSEQIALFFKRSKNFDITMGSFNCAEFI